MNCSHCGGPEEEISYVCSGCFDAQYCSEACGNAHWNDDNHAVECTNDELIGKKEKWIKKAIKNLAHLPSKPIEHTCQPLGLQTR